MKSNAKFKAIDDVNSGVELPDAEGVAQPDLSELEEHTKEHVLGTEDVASNAIPFPKAKATQEKKSFKDRFRGLNGGAGNFVRYGFAAVFAVSYALLGYQVYDSRIKVAGFDRLNREVGQQRRELMQLRSAFQPSQGAAAAQLQNALNEANQRIQTLEQKLNAFSQPSAAKATQVAETKSPTKSSVAQRKPASTKKAKPAAKKRK